MKALLPEQCYKHSSQILAEFFFLFGKNWLNSPRANKRAQSTNIVLNYQYYGLKRMSLRVDFRNDRDWVSLGAGGRVFYR